MKINETRKGDLNACAGIVIRCKNSVLTARPSPSVKWPSPLLDIPKGRLRQGETIKEGAIRECFGETGVKFEPWKLENPIRINYCGAHLYLFLANIASPIPLEQLSCPSTFIDSDGIRKHECCGFAWINPYAQIHLVQDGIRFGIMYYFNKLRYEEDCQTAGAMTGGLPANVSKVLALGYKPKTRH